MILFFRTTLQKVNKATRPLVEMGRFFRTFPFVVFSCRTANGARRAAPIMFPALVPCSMLLLLPSCSHGQVFVEATYQAPAVTGIDFCPTSVFIRSEADVEIQKIRLKGRTIWSGEGDRFPDFPDLAWCQLWPTRLRSGNRCELKLLPRMPLPRDATVEIVYRAEAETEESIVEILPKPSALQWKGITFADRLRTIWFALQRDTNTEARLTSILINGLESLDAVISESSLPCGEKSIRVVGVRLERMLERGDDVYIVCKTDDGECAAARVRADDLFPMDEVGGRFLPEVGLDGGQFWSFWAPGELREDKGLSYVCLMGCPAHRHGTREEALLRIRERYLSFRRSGLSKAIGYVFVCKTQQDETLALFSPLADAVLTNPLEILPDEISTSRYRRSSELIELIYRCVSPSPWYALISTHQDKRFRQFRDRPATKDEVEHLVWLSIGGGAKGLIYRDKGPENYRGARLGRINAKVRKLLPRLRYAIPVVPTDVCDGKAHLAVLQAGVEELIVIVTNNTLHCIGPELSSTSLQLLRELRVEVPIPRGTKVKKPHDNNSLENEFVESGIYSFVIDCLRYVHVSRIKLCPEAQ